MKDAEAGFTLVELLVVIVILGSISYFLANSVILGLKTTNGTANRVSGTSAVSALNSYFFGDVHSADQVTTTGTSTTDSNCTGLPGVLLHLSWTDQKTTNDVFYSFDPPTSPMVGDQVLVRTRCTDTAAPASTILGRFSHAPADPEPVQLSCGVAPTPGLCTNPSLVTTFCGGPRPPCPDGSMVTLAVMSDPTAPSTELTAVRQVPTS